MRIDLTKEEDLKITVAVFAPNDVIKMMGTTLKTQL